MNYLFIDTAEGTRVLLSYGGKTYYREDMRTAGSEILLPLIDEVIKCAGTAIDDIEVFGACVGPGSFTGLRIGLTTIKAFCYAKNKPCFAVNSLRLNAYNNYGKKKVISIADAGNKVCYIAVYDGDKEIMPPTCVTREAVSDIIAEERGVSVTTDSKLADVFDGNSKVGEREMLFAAKAAIEKTMSYKELLPLYIRKPQPERGAGDL